MESAWTTVKENASFPYSHSIVLGGFDEMS
jgi:hypothetical protein